VTRPPHLKTFSYFQGIRTSSFASKGFLSPITAAFNSSCTLSSKHQQIFSQRCEFSFLGHCLPRPKPSLSCLRVFASSLNWAAAAKTTFRWMGTAQALSVARFSSRRQLVSRKPPDMKTTADQALRQTSLRCPNQPAEKCDRSRQTAYCPSCRRCGSCHRLCADSSSGFCVARARIHAPWGLPVRSRTGRSRGAIHI
jgi:hypothetical protein